MVAWGSAHPRMKTTISGSFTFSPQLDLSKSHFESFFFYSPVCGHELINRDSPQTDPWCSPKVRAFLWATQVMELSRPLRCEGVLEKKNPVGRGSKSNGETKRRGRGRVFFRGWRGGGLGFCSFLSAGSPVYFWGGLVAISVLWVRLSKTSQRINEADFLFKAHFFYMTKRGNHQL